MKQSADTIRALISRIAFPMFPTWTLRFNPGTTGGEGRSASPYLQVHGWDTCAKTGQTLQWTGRKWLISYWMCDTEVICTAYKAIQAAVEHEMREKFLVDGLAVFDPHRSLESMLEAARVEAIDVREDSINAA